MDDFLHDAEAGRSVASEGSFWNSQDDAKLWYHYRNGDIDPHNNNREYLLRKSQQYFPTKSQNRETVIRCLRDKNTRRKLELSVTGSRQHRGKWLIAAFCFCVSCLNFVMFILCLGNSDDRDNEDTEDMYKDSKEAVAVVRVTAMRRSSSLEGRGIGGGKADPPNPSNDEIIAAMGGMVISSFQPFCFDVKFPFMVFYTHFVGRRRFCVVDLLVLSMHESRYQVDISENGMSILIGTEMPTFYTSSGRLEDEIPLQGDRDTLLAAHQEVVDLIISRHGSREVMSTNPQVIKLPFPCDQDISKQMIWNEGDHLLYEMFCRDPEI